MHNKICLVAITACLLVLVPTASAQSGMAVSDQEPASQSATRNLSMVRTVSMEAVALDVDQTAERPFVYVAARNAPGFTVISLVDGSTVGKWIPTSPDFTVDLALGGSDGRYFLAVVADSRLDLVDVTNPRQPALLRSISLSNNGSTAAAVRGVFAYRHSNGASLIGVATGAEIRLFDFVDLDEGSDNGIGIATPEQLERGTSGFDTVYMQYHLPSGQDRLYGGGAGGYHLFNISDPARPELLASVNPATIARGQAVAPTPDGRYIVTTAGYEWSPVRIFDLQPMFDGETSLVRTSESAWTPNWKGLTRSVEIRWPLVFTASSGDGLQIFNLRDPAAPYTIGYFATSDQSGSSSGAFDLDVRNVDGLIVVADSVTGLWILRLDEMQRWNGHGYGQPNTSSAQDWVRGPDMTGPE